MKQTGFFGILLAVALASSASAATVNVGDIFTLQNDNGTTQFYIDNATGSDLCFSPDAPICTSVALSGTLSYSYLDELLHTVTGSAVIGPIGPDSEIDFHSYTTDEFIIPSLQIITASFTGTFSPVNLTIDQGAGIFAPFQSTGAVVSTEFDPAVGYALLVTDITGTSGTEAPEPATPILMLAGGLALAAGLRGRRLQL